MHHLKRAGARAAAVAAALLCATEAQAQNVVAELNAVHIGDLDGGELGIGYNFKGGNWRLTPIVGGLLYQGDNDRYALQTFSNGNEVCRDLTNGQFAKKENCDDTAVKAYGKLEARYVFNQKFQLGAGVRFGDDTTVYGKAALMLSDRFAIQGFGGKDYYGVGAGFGF